MAFSSEKRLKMARNSSSYVNCPGQHSSAFRTSLSARTTIGLADDTGRTKTDDPDGGEQNNYPSIMLPWINKPATCPYRLSGFRPAG